MHLKGCYGDISRVGEEPREEAIARSRSQMGIVSALGAGDYLMGWPLVVI